MNKLKAEITAIDTSGKISLITLVCAEENFSALLIDNGEDYIQKGNLVYMIFKETEVSIGKNLSGKLSTRNRFPSKITALEKKELLTEIKLDFKGREIVSVITTKSCEHLDLKIGDEVEGVLKTNELMLMRYD